MGFFSRVRNDSANFGNFPEQPLSDEDNIGSKAAPPAPWSASSRELPTVNEEREPAFNSPKRFVYLFKGVNI